MQVTEHNKGNNIYHRFSSLYCHVARDTGTSHHMTDVMGKIKLFLQKGVSVNSLNV